MSRFNNVDVESVQQFEEQIKQDPTAARKTQFIEGEWILDEGDVQFQSSIQYENGETVFKVDNPTFMGGGGKLPGPMHYCFYGLASCYTGTFATMAAMLGIELKKLTTRVEADVNFSRVFGVSEEPTMEEVRVTLQVESDAPEEKIKEAEELAIQRCPVVFTLKNPVKLTPKVEILKK
ncbi:OsmC family peroxiredoxin [Candidatus Saccharibacteria bacterium]|nr:OsmC family peroxiredoxin [Calditrichia bacterium]NIV72838.1 OsmC family peroxiredoxin [Calditrichia bacterium]NIW00018.1 OsmC family peroxiredoxin [Candidatus Saccharibacteria bacterium]NIW80388.1 OsmC family peroxiredoxin [Calditrichia bacterium]